MSSRPVTPVAGAPGTMQEPSLPALQPEPVATPPPRLTSSSRAVSQVSHVPSVSRYSQAGSTAPGPQPLEHSEGAPRPVSALSQNDMTQVQGDESAERPSSMMRRSNSQLSQSQSQTQLPSRGGTLRKKSSLHRTSSKRSSYAGSVKSLRLGEKEKYAETDENMSVFFCPVPTNATPTQLLADRFQAWRKILKDIINYFRELSKGFDARSKSILAAANVINNTNIPQNFLNTGGIGDAAYILRDFHKQAQTEATKARDLEDEVVTQLTGLRSDLQQKIKEIKGLSGDFKNNVEKEQEGTRKAVKSLTDALGMVDHDAAATSGKGDPFIIKLGVDRQVEKQIEEENYLHRAFLNLEASGRELESIVVGEIQKAYNVLAGILRRDADEAYDTAEKLKEGPLQMGKDHEWDSFCTSNNQMLDPRQPIRQVSHVTYPGKDHPAAIEVKSGMLERKSKYLKNYTPGWYILSPTHLHEFKSADRIASQSPIMSLYLPEQKLGTHSEPESSSHKFMLKGRQSGSMHRGHSWVFRAETHDTMLAWFGDIKELSEKRGEARNEFVRRTHSRSISGNSLKAPSIGSSEGGVEEDEADQQPFSGEQSVRGQSVAEGAPAGEGLGVPGDEMIGDNRSEAGWRPPQRPSPGGRFPSQVDVQRGLQAPASPSSGNGSESGREAIAAAGALPGSGLPFVNSGTTQSHTDLQRPGDEGAGAATSAPPALQQTQVQPQIQQSQVQQPYVNTAPREAAPVLHQTQVHQPHVNTAPHEAASQYGEWMAPIAAGTGGAAIGAGGMHHLVTRNPAQPEGQLIENIDNSERQMEAASPVPAYGTSSVPIPVVGGYNASRSRGVTESTEAPTMASSTYPSSGFAPTASNMTDATTVSNATTTATEFSTRPGLDHVKTSKSVMTISELPMPGKFPQTPINQDELMPGVAPIPPR